MDVLRASDLEMVLLPSQAQVPCERPMWGLWAAHICELWIKRNIGEVHTPYYHNSKPINWLCLGRIRGREARLSMVITHLRMALSSATSATVVAPFTTNRPSVAPIADLLREGRGKATDHRVDWVNCQHVHPIWHIVQKRCQILLSYESLVLEISCCHTLRDGGWWWWWWWRSWWSWWWFDLYIDLNA